MGFGLYSLDVPVTKTSSALLCMTKDEVSRYEETACINCGRCVEACPEQLVPSRLADASVHHREEWFEQHIRSRVLRVRLLQLRLSGEKTADPVHQIHAKNRSRKEEKEIGGRKMSELLKVSSNPHVRARMKTDNIMLLVLIALLPSAFFGVVNFGLRSLAVLAVSVVSAVLTEYLYEKLMHKKITIGDFSAAVTGLLLGLNLPSTVPLWLPVIGNVFAILFVKQLFGGLGQNFMNPALAGRCFLLISFAGKNDEISPGTEFQSATPLAASEGRRICTGSGYVSWERRREPSARLL